MSEILHPGLRSMTIKMAKSWGVMPQTGFMRFGDHIQMDARLLSGESVFGPIDQIVVQAGRVR